MLRTKNSMLEIHTLSTVNETGYKKLNMISQFRISVKMCTKSLQYANICKKVDLKNLPMYIFWINLICIIVPFWCLHYRLCCRFNIRQERRTFSNKDGMQPENVMMKILAEERGTVFFFTSQRQFSNKWSRFGTANGDQEFALFLICSHFVSTLLPGWSSHGDKMLWYK